MSSTTNLIKYLVILVFVVALLGIAAWYLFLDSKKDNVQVESDARGLQFDAPSFTGSTGNTYENIRQFVSGTHVPSKSATVAPPPQLWHVSLNPVAGADFVQTSEGERLYFVERAGGNVLSADLLTGGILRLTNTLVPKVYGAAFSRDGGVVLHSLDQSGRPTLFVGVITSPPKQDTEEVATVVGTLEGSFFGTSIHSFAVSPVSRHVAYLTTTQEGGWMGVRRAWDGTGEKSLFETPLRGWRMYWLDDDRIVVSQNAADNIPGYAYEVLKGGVLRPLVRNVPGLVIAPRPDLKSILFSISQGGTLALFAKTGDVTTPIPLKTIADKCVWAPQANERPSSDNASYEKLIAYCAAPQELAQGDILNNWYKGRYHTADAWWQVDVSTGEVVQLTLPSEEIDVENPVINESGTAIAFMNFSDKSLWMLRIPSREAAVE